MGRLEFPAELQASRSVISPYLSNWSISTAGTGAGATKSRRNLLRPTQVAG